MKRYAAPSILCFLLIGCAAIETRTPPAVSAESLKLKEIFECYFETYLELFPLFATRIGDHRYDDRITVNIGAEQRALQRKLWKETLDQLATVKLDDLSVKERLFHETLKRALIRQIGRASCRERESTKVSN